MDCADFDGQVVRQDDEVALLAEQFVCVRIQSMNGINLRQFPFEFDLTWMSFFQDADGRPYTRYGGRDGNDAEEHLSQESLVMVMKQVLKLHKSNDVQPENRYEPKVDSTFIPEDITTMGGMLSRRNESCIHCHDVKAARFRELREEDKLDKSMVFTYPSPSRLGINLNRDRQQRIQEIIASSPADDAGLEAGDLLLELDGQRVLTFADATRVLDFFQGGDELPVAVQRDGQRIESKIDIPMEWRKTENPGWRASVESVGPNGGFWGSPANARERRNLGIDADALAFKVNFIWGDHTRKAGIRNGDIIVEIDGQTTNMIAREIHAHLQMNREWGETVDVKLRRGDRVVETKMTLPASPPH